MDGLMMTTPLSMTTMFDRAEQLFPKKQIVTAHAEPASSARPTASGPSAPAVSAMCSTCSASAPTGRVATFAWNTARHLELYFAPPCSGRVAHTLNVRLFPEQLSYIVNHAEDEVIFVDRSVAALLWPLIPSFATVQAHRRDGRRRPAKCPTRRSAPAVHDYDELLRAATPIEFTGPQRREPSGVDDVHERHHRQPEGRHLLAPLDRVAHDGHDVRRLARRARVRRDPARRPDVPRQRVGPRARGRRNRRDAGDARTRPLAQGDRRSDRERAGHVGGRRPDDLDGGAARARRARRVVVAGHPVRRLGGAQGAVRRVPREGRLADPASVGHDRDEPARVGVQRQEHDARPSRRRARGPAHLGRPRDVPHRVPHRRAGDPQPAAVGRDESRRAAGARSVDRPQLLQRRAHRESRSPRTVGCAPATSPSSATRATSRSSTAPRTSSSPAANGSARSSSRTRSWRILRSRKRP